LILKCLNLAEKVQQCWLSKAFTKEASRTKIPDFAFRVLACISVACSIYLNQCGTKPHCAMLGSSVIKWDK
jgi:hypothetical protein